MAYALWGDSTYASLQLSDISDLALEYDFNIVNFCSVYGAGYASKGHVASKREVAPTLIIELGYNDPAEISWEEVERRMLKMPWFQCLESQTEHVKTVILVKQPSYYQSFVGKKAKHAPPNNLIQASRWTDEVARFIEARLNVVVHVVEIPGERYFDGLLRSPDGSLRQDKRYLYDYKEEGIEHSNAGEVALWSDCVHPTRAGAIAHLRTVIKEIKARFPCKKGGRWSKDRQESGSQTCRETTTSLMDSRVHGWQSYRGGSWSSSNVGNPAGSRSEWWDAGKKDASSAVDYHSRHSYHQEYQQSGHDKKKGYSAWYDHEPRSSWEGYRDEKGPQGRTGWSEWQRLEDDGDEKVKQDTNYEWSEWHGYSYEKRYWEVNKDVCSGWVDYASEKPCESDRQPHNWKSRQVTNDDYRRWSKSNTSEGTDAWGEWRGLYRPVKADRGCWSKERLHGSVISFKEHWGWIRCRELERDVFAHEIHVVKGTLCKGVSVVFDVGTDPKTGRERALKIVVTDWNQAQHEEQGDTRRQAFG